MSYSVTKSRVLQWIGIIIIIGVFVGAYWYFKVYGSTLNQSQNDFNTNGLVGMWSFNGDDISGTTAYDRSGSDNNGTLSGGPTPIKGKVGQALSFDGSNDYMTEAAIDLSGTDKASVALWLSQSSFRADDGLAFEASADTGSSVTGFYLNPNSNGGGSCAGLLSVVVKGNVGVNSACYTRPSTGDWHQYVVIIDKSQAANEVELYIDGILQTPTTRPTTNNNTNNLGNDPWYLMSRAGTTIFNPGRVDDIRIYNRVLSAGEVQSLYTAGGGTKSNTSVSQPQGTGRLDSDLALYWKFDDGSGSTALDASVNSLNGTASGGPTWTTGQVGGAAYFDGSARFTNSSSGSIPLNPTDGESFTLAAWFNRDAFTGDDTIIAKRTGQSVTSEGYIAYIDGTTDKLTFEVSDDVDEYQLESVSTFTATGWYHFVVSWNDVSGATLYINGVAEAATVTGTFANIGDLTNSTGFAVGADSIAANLFNGAIDEARIYGRALVADEVFQLYRLTAPTGIDTSLKGYWSFNAQDMPSSTTAADRSGASNTGTLTNGPTKVLGKLGQALSFDGADDYTTVADANSLDITGAISMGAWVKTSDTDSCIMSKTVVSTAKCFESTGNKVYEIGILSNTIYFQTSNGTTANVLSGSASGITDNQWHYLVTTWDGTTGTNGMKLYLDGVLLYQSTATVSSIQSTSSAFTFGGDSGSYDYAGLLDEARLYNRALSAAEVKALYDAGESDKANSSVSQPQGTGRLDSGLAGYWKLDDGSGTSATDSSTNGITGTLNGTSTWGTGQIGSSVTFDGTDDYITAGDRSEFEMSSTNSLSFGGWFKVAAYPSGNRGFLITKGGSAGSGPSYEYELHVNGFNSNKLRFAIYNDSGVSAYMYIDSTTVPALDTWFHVMAIWDAQDTAIKLYYNGVLEATSTSTTSGIHNAKLSHFVIGKRDDDAESDHNGAADEVRVYSRALSGDEVAQLYRLATPTAIDTGLKGYWSFNGQDMLSSTTAADRSGAGNTGTLTNGPTKVIGKIGQALSFDGTDDYVTAGSNSSLDGMSAMTLSAWIYPESMGENSKGRIFDKAAANNPTNGFELNIANNESNYQLAFAAAFSTTNLERRSIGSSLEINTWQHVVLTWDGSLTATNAKLYVNGVEVSYAVTTSGVGSRSSDASESLLIGNSFSGDRAFDGSIDEARVYNRVLSAAEITALYNQGR